LEFAHLLKGEVVVLEKSEARASNLASPSIGPVVPWVRRLTLARMLTWRPVSVHGRASDLPRSDDQGSNSV